MATTSLNPESSVKLTDSPRPRWWPGAVLLLVGTAVAALLWRLDEDNPTRQTFGLYFACGITFVLFAIWWTAFSGYARRTRLTGLGLLFVPGIVFGSVYRIEGFTGEMHPIIRNRWTPRPQPAPAVFASASSASSLGDPLETGFGDWPGFRGPRRDGIVDVPIRTDWTTRPPKLVWRHSVGNGWSSFCVVGRRAWTMEQRGANEAVVCYDFETGRELWARSYPTEFHRPPSGPGPRSTPTFFEGQIFTLGATGLLTCWKADSGDRVWQKDTLKEAGADNLPWGTAASPLVYRDSKGEGPYVLVNPGGVHGNSVMAYGPRPWRAGTAVAGYASPMFVTLSGRRHVLVYDGAGLAGYDPDTGRQLWRQKWENYASINCAQPIVVGPNRLFASSGYSLGSVLLEFDADLKPKVLWESNQMRCKFNSPVNVGGHIYGLDEGLLACLDLANGKRLWKKGRYGFGQVLLVSDLLLIQAESGTIHLVRPAPSGPTELAKFQALDGRAWNEPVLCRGKLLVRNNAEAACFDVSEK